jgi:hypothetical protein
MAIGKAKRKRPHDLERHVQHSFTHFRRVGDACGREARFSIDGRLSPARFEKNPGEGRISAGAIQATLATELGAIPSFL